MFRDRISIVNDSPDEHEITLVPPAGYAMRGLRDLALNTACDIERATAGGGAAADQADICTLAPVRAAAGGLAPDPGADARGRAESLMLWAAVSRASPILLALTLLGGHWALAQEPGGELWSPQRIQAALAAVDKAHAAGITSDARYAQKRAMLEKRLAGTFEGTALSNADPAEVDLIQNGGFEEINPNSDAKRSRWLWWEGWDWGGDYENFWAEAPNVHSGRYAAGIRCTGQKGRIGIFTPQLPILPGVQRYDLTLWAKGEGDNELFINFESGCTGTLRQRVPEEWTEIQLTGEPEPGAQGFGLYLYVTGEGTIYLDDVKLVPVGGEVGE